MLNAPKTGRHWAFMEVSGLETYAEGKLYRYLDMQFLLVKWIGSLWLGVETASHGWWNMALEVWRALHLFLGEEELYLRPG
jgi:hypothetical protein